jgi:hypothetical protein
MTKVKLVLLGMLAVFAVSAAASSSASAAQRYWDCQPVSGTGHWSNSHCTTPTTNGSWETKEITETKISIQSETAELKTTIAKEKVTIWCDKDAGKGFLLSGGKSSGEIEFTQCRLLDKNGNILGACTVSEPILVKFVDQLVGEHEDEIKPEPGEPFVNITVGGSLCALKGTFATTGTQTCEIPNPMQSLEEHQLECLPAGSNLKFGTEAATFKSNEHIHIPGAQWGITS